MSEFLPVIETLESRLMRAWAGGDKRTLKALTSRRFRMVMGSKPSAILDASSWLEAAAGRFVCKSYRFGDVYARRVGSIAVFATQLELKAEMDGHDWSGLYWVTDVWQRSRVRRNWQIIERVISRPVETPDASAAIRSLQLWR